MLAGAMLFGDVHVDELRQRQLTQGESQIPSKQPDDSPGLLL